MPDWITQSDASRSEHPLARFVARQPILDRRKNTFGYELLYRSGWQNHFCADGEVASRAIIDNALAFGMRSIVGTTVPFVNCTRDLILQDLPTLLPKGTVLEILETAQVDEELVRACKRLRSMGYLLALDDFDFGEQWEPILQIADFVKMDFRSSTPEQRRRLITRMMGKKVRFVAEKVETDAEFRMAANEGFHLYQGYFFARPVMMARPALASILQRIRLLNELSQSELALHRVLPLLKEEPSISYRVLQLANSACMGVRETVSDLGAALLLIGETEFRKLAVVALTAELCGTQPLEVHRMILQKARFCELMAEDLHLIPDHMYLLGMLAAVKSVLQLSAETLANCTRLHPQMMAALTGQENICSWLLECAAGHERGDWEALATASAHIGQSEEMVSMKSLQAIHWADDIVSRVS